MEQYNYIYKPEQLRSIIREELKPLLNKTKNNQGSSTDTYLNVKEAAKLLKLSVHTLRKKCQQQTVPCYKRNGKWIFSKKELIAYIEEGKQLTNSSI